ncbi:hypothetical protein E1264_42055, partial [Actinomadura sp. KC216]
MRVGWWENAVDVASGAVADDVHLFGVGVFEAVVPSAAQGEPVDVGGGAEGPAGDVVDFAEGAGDFASLDGAGGVEGFEDLALAGGGESGPLPEVQRHMAAAEDEGRDARVERDAADLLGWE